MDKKQIDNLRKATGTLPSEKPERKTELVRGCERLKVTMIDWPTNPYKAIVESVCATWGDDKYELKWNKLTPENRYRVVLAALTGNTLPQSLESVNFTWQVYGTPRHCFDQHARARIGTTFFSIGSRDNNKLDTSFVLYTKLYDKMHSSEHKRAAIQHFDYVKDLYEWVLEDGEGSWQTARAFLPMSYHHPYCFRQNFLALQGQCGRRMHFCEEEFIVGVHWLLRETVKEKFPLMADYLKPVCDKAKKCVYANSYTLSNLFGCLFAGCGRWPAGTDYSTFNESCSDKDTVEKQIGISIPGPSDWFDWSMDDYDKLDKKDKKLFEAN